MKRGSGFSRWMKKHPATPRARTAYANMPGPPAPLAGACMSVAQRLAQDEYRCPVCNITWGVDEPKPACQRTPSPKGNP